MTYAQKDRSISDGAPIECYRFVSSFKTWRFTSYHESITVAGQLFTPLAIVRTAIETGNVVDTLTTMDFIVPSQHEIAKTFCYTRNPKGLVVTVYRVHEGDDYSTDYKIEYQGEIAGSSATGIQATIKTASILQTRLNGNLSSVYYQKTCNHTLFDARCKVNRATYTQTAYVTEVQKQLISVDNMVFATGALAGGEMTNIRTGEKQGIVGNAANVITLGYPFFDILAGDQIELTQGCDHMRLGHCKNRFNNVVNYGGMDFIPEVNPFEQLSYQTTTSTTTNVRTEQQNKLILPESSS